MDLTFLYAHLSTHSVYLSICPFIQSIGPSTDIDIGVENFMESLDSGVHVCKLASLIHQKAVQAHIEDPTLPGVSTLPWCGARREGLEVASQI